MSPPDTENTMNKNVIGTTAAAVTAALTVLVVVRAVLPDVRRYLRISRM